jgi:hypothetical protein
MLPSAGAPHGPRIIYGWLVERRKLSDKTLKAFGAFPERAQQTMGVTAVENAAVLHAKFHAG